MSLRWRVAMAFAVVVAACSWLLSASSYFSMKSQLLGDRDEKITAQAIEIGEGLGPGPAERDAATGCPPALVFDDLTLAQLTRPDGSVVACFGTDRLPGATAPTTGVTLTTVATTSHRYRVATTAFHNGGSLQVARSIDDLEATIRGVGRRLLAWSCAFTVLGGIAGWWLARALLRPLEAMRLTVRRLTESRDLALRVPASGPPELRAFGNDLNTLVTALAESRQQQRHLVADASHELRTPLTSLSANAELLERSDELTLDERLLILAAIRADTGELATLVSDLVALATDAHAEEAPGEFELSEVAAEVALRVRRRGADIEVVDESTSSFVGRRAMVQRALANLVDNAVKYAPASAIVVRVDDHAVEVLDRGPGLDSDGQRRAFDRFWRAPSARSLPGTGLGLAIVAQTAAAHGGTTWFRDRPGGGSVIGFSLPSVRRNDGPPSDPSRSSDPG